jgi:hypothetical protein
MDGVHGESGDERRRTSTTILSAQLPALLFRVLSRDHKTIGLASWALARQYSDQGAPPSHPPTSKQQSAPCVSFHVGVLVIKERRSEDRKIGRSEYCCQNAEAFADWYYLLWVANNAVWTGWGCIAVACYRVVWQPSVVVCLCSVRAFVRGRM